MEKSANDSIRQVSEPSQPLNGFVILVACIAAVAGILFGFDTGVISGAILFIKQEYALSSAMNGIVVGAVLFGALVSSAVSSRFSDHFGRRNLLITTAIVFLIGTLGSAFSPNVLILTLSRFIVGAAIGMASFAAPLYLSEIAPTQYRGALVSLNQLAITLGIVLSYVVDLYYSETGAWRWMLGFGVVPALILFFGMLFLPKSPRWMMLKGFSHEAREVLQKIRGVEDVEQELTEIRSTLQKKNNWRLLFQLWLRPAFIIALGLALLQQCTGINTIIYYAPTIFKMSGLHSNTAAILATLGVGVVNVLFTIIALPLIDRWGRRPLLLMGLSGMALTLIVLSVAFHFAGHADFLKWVAFGSMVLYIACFAMSLGPIMWLVIPEVFPLEVRGLGSGLMVSACWAFNAMVSVSFLTLVDALSASGAFLIYAVLSILGWIFVQRIVPETKGVTLESIEKKLRAGVKSRELGRPV